tara:strand:+ start:276 stop:779 length:504 start_codon:yes stop_codon:yes gene_type:complete
MGYYTKNNKRGGNIVSNINNTINIAEFIFFISFFVFIFVFWKQVKEEKIIDSSVNRRVLFGEELPSPDDNHDFTVAVARELEDRVQQGLELGKNIANEIKEEPVIMNPINQAIFYDAELPPEENDLEANIEGNTSFMVATYRPLDDLKKGVVKFFKNNQSPKGADAV